MTRRILLAFTLFTAVAVAQDGKPKDETAETADGVKIGYRYYAATGEGNNSVVVMVHEYNVDPKKGDWDGLAKTIAAKGFHVFYMNLRGHGESKEVLPEKFWNDPRNLNYLSSSLAQKKSTKIDVADFKQGYYTTLANDLAGLRLQLDLKNDDGKINTRSIYFIAAGNAAPLVHLFIATEWSRAQVKPPPIGLFGTVQDTLVAHGRRSNGTEVAGHDYAGVVFLSPTRTYTYPSGKSEVKARIDDSSIRDWVTRFSYDKLGGGGDLRRETSMLYIHGEKDDEGRRETQFFYKNVMNADGSASPKLEKMKNTRIAIIPAPSAKERSVDLLGKNNAYHTEDEIIKFLEQVRTARKDLNPITRKYDKPLRINWQSFNVN